MFVEFFTTIVGLSIPILAILAWYSISSRRKKEKITELNKKDATEVEDGEYHNDFSKVPAGHADPLQPLPRSIGYGYGVGGQTLEEDLERIESKIAEDKKTNHD